MDADAVQQIRKAFMEARPINRFTYCLRVLAGTLVMREHQDTFSDVYMAWNSDYAKPYRQYLDVAVPDIRPVWFYALYSLISNRTAQELFDDIVPDLFRGETVSVLKYLDVKADTTFLELLRPSFYKLLSLLAVVLLAQQMYHSEYPSQVLRLNTPEEYKNAINQSFQSWEHYGGKFEKLKFFDDPESLYQLWMRVQGVTMHPISIKVTGTVQKPIEELQNAGFDNESILRLYFGSKEKDRNLYSALYQAFGITEADKEFHFPDNTTMEFVTGREQLLQQTMSAWRRANASHIIRALYFRRSAQNIGAENDVIYPLLRPLYSSDRTALIIEPSPFFIKSMQEDRRLSTPENYVFAFFSKVVAMVYKRQYPSFRFAFLSLDSSKLIEIKQNPNKYASVSTPYLDECLDTSFSLYICFTRSWIESSLPSILTWLSTQMCHNTELLFCMPHALWDRTDNSLREVIGRFYDPKWIMLLPSQSDTDWFYKNMVASLTVKEDNSPSSAKTCRIVRSNRHILNPGASVPQELVCQDPWPVCVPSEQLFTGRKTINTLWDEYRPKPPKERSRDGKKYYDYSREIRVWYSWSKGRGRYAFYDPPKKTLKAGCLERGKCISSHTRFSAKSDESAKNRLEAILSSADFKPELRKLIKKSLMKLPERTFSLKTVWFLCIELLQTKSIYNHDLAIELFTSKTFADLMPESKWTAENYHEELKKAFPDTTDTEYLALLRQLNLILGTAVKEGYFPENPLSDSVAKLLSNDKNFREVRKALMKTSFTLEEEKRMLRFLRGHLPQDSEFVGAAISFYTGMTNREICALTWKDFHKIPDLRAWQLWVFKQVNDEEKTENIPPDKKYVFRRVPCVKPLADLLLNRKNYVIQALQGQDMYNESAFENYPIVCNEADFTGLCKVNMLKRAKNIMESEAGIVPITDEAVKKTDFNEYGADRFRSNIRYRTSQTCGMSLGEMNYILGLTPPTTFSQHYCDYTNDFAQLMLCRKLERWSALHTEAIHMPEVHTLGDQLKLEYNDGSRGMAEFDLSLSDDEAVSLDIVDERGVDVTCVKLPEIRGEYHE